MKLFVKVDVLGLFMMDSSETDAFSIWAYATFGSSAHLSWHKFLAAEARKLWPRQYRFNIEIVVFLSSPLQSRELTSSTKREGCREASPYYVLWYVRHLFVISTTCGDVRKSSSDWRHANHPIDIFIFLFSYIFLVWFHLVHSIQCAREMRWGSFAFAELLQFRHESNLWRSTVACAISNNVAKSFKWK